MENQSVQDPQFSTHQVLHPKALVLGVVFLLLFIVGVAAYSLTQSPAQSDPIQDSLLASSSPTVFVSPAVSPQPIEEELEAEMPAEVMCTMDAKQCPDGSFVGRTGPKCEFAPCPGETANIAWKEHSVADAKLSFSAPPEMEVTSETNKDESGKIYAITFYVQKGIGSQTEYYQLYGLYQFGPQYAQSPSGTFSDLKKELNPTTAKTITVGGYQALEGQLKGARNRYVTYIITEQGMMSLFTAEPTLENKTLSDQILETFRFTK